MDEHPSTHIYTYTHVHNIHIYAYTYIHPSNTNTYPHPTNTNTYPHPTNTNTNTYHAQVDMFASQWVMTMFISSESMPLAGLLRIW